MARTPRASIIIVAASGGELLRSCLQRLRDVAPTVAHETIVVLNGAAEGEAELVREFAPEVLVHVQAVRLGFAGALNVGRSLARGELLVSLHDDAEVHPGWLEALVAAIDRDPEAGAVGSLVLGVDGRVQAAGWELVRDGSTRPPWAGTPPDPAAFTAPAYVDYSPSSSLMVRASSWDDAGGVDERFFPLYFVDVDLCLALRARGQLVVCEPASVVVHHKGASMDADYARFVAERNRDLLLEKWGEFVGATPPGSGAPLALPGHAIPAQERATEDATRESLALLRDAATRTAYADELRARLAAREAEAETRRGELEWIRSELHVAHAALEATRADALLAAGERDRTADRLSELQARSAWLERRSQTLDAIEGGRWWRIRGALLPLLTFARSLRSARR